MNGDFLRFSNAVMMRVVGKVQGGLGTERCFALYIGMRFHANDTTVIRWSDGVIARTLCIQLQKREETKDMLDVAVAVP